FPLLLYNGSSILITLMLTGALTAKGYGEGFNIPWLIAIACVSLIATSHLAVTFINWLVTLLIHPHFLSRMDYSSGIDPESRTLVAVPSMLTSVADVENLIETMEVRFLANRDENLHFALLTDFADAKTESLPEDKPLLELAEQKIIALNKKYQREKNDTFFLFHCPRRLNAIEKKWMGYERKRGKLSELNGLLRGRGRESFLLIVGESEIFPKIKYVITLDSDTQLPRETAWKIIATISHPLNQAIYNPAKGRVTDGYGILQPRLATSLPRAHSSLFAKMHGNEPGIDPYTRAVSNVYQDLLQEGSFIGKGIYEVDIFEEALNNRFPENRILSHDLLEGCYTRSGLISDVQLYEEYPSGYLADMKRRHRWVRGDWQIARWLFRRVPGIGKRTQKNPLSSLSRWKIFDNLRRSLVAPALFFLLLFGWMISDAPWFWTISIIGIIITTSLLMFIWSIYKKPVDVLLRQHVTNTIRNVINDFIQHVFMFICLPYEAYINLHAIMLTAWRMIFTRRKLLEWNPSANVAINNQWPLSSYFTMWFAPVISAGVFIYLSAYAPLSLVIAGPVLLLWIASPFVAWWISRSRDERKENLTAHQTIFLQRMARKTWAFFENFVGQEDNWLPPDNYQEHLISRIAHRTSPTNMGLSLLANLSAYDFGYLTSEQLIHRTNNAITTMQHLERYHGHFFNWYDTRTLMPLPPKYVSTVDSGNLAGMLLTLKQGILSLANQKICSERLFEGLRDTAGVLAEKVKDNELLKELQEEIETLCLFPPSTLEAAKISIDHFSKLTVEIVQTFGASSLSEIQWWVNALDAQCQSALQEFVTLAPWLVLQPAPLKFTALYSEIPANPTLSEVAQMSINLTPKINLVQEGENTTEEKEWLETLAKQIVVAAGRAKERLMIIERLSQECDELSDMEYDFLFDKTKHLLSIGYNADEHRRDAGFYDLLGSESRIGVFVAIAQGKIPQESWFALGRQLSNPGTDPVLMSWSGSMFEYLMPMLIMPNYENTLLDQTCRAVVQRQIEYGKKRESVWGISESGYNMVDAHLNYQYRAFGVPGLGLKRGLGEDFVIAPYATVMALMIAPQAACKNLEELVEQGFEGRYGFFEAIDYTPARLPRGQSFAVIRSYMAHHEGMSLLALAYYLLNQPMQKRFESEPQLQSTLLLLQERVPQVTSFYLPAVAVADIAPVSATDTEMRVINTPHTPIPEIQLLSNGNYHVMITNSGGGYSRWKDVALTRWREDTTCDNWGTFCFIRDLESGVFWSSAHQPALKPADHYEVIFSQGRAEFRRRDNNLETHTEIVVSPEDDVEIRRVHITNHSRKSRSIEITSYAEVVLNTAMADAIHPAFNNLFVQTEIIDSRQAILCTRRPRSIHEQPPWIFHLMKVHEGKVQNVSYETNRDQFIGRGNTISDPRVMHHSDPLTASQGSVLDPIVSIQYRITLNPLESVAMDMVYGIGATREVCSGLIDKYQDRHLIDRAFELAWTHSQVVLRQINATESDSQLYGRLASSVIFVNPSVRTDVATIMRNQRGQSGLWSYAVSGDLPIVLLQIEDSANIGLVKQLVQAHAYWRFKGLVVDLVIWNEDHGGYRQTLQNQMLALINPGIANDLQDKPGGIFIRSSDQISNEDRILFQTVARVVIADKWGTLEGQMNRRSPLKGMVPAFTPLKFYPSVDKSIPLPDDLNFFNGTGGFSPEGKEYVIITDQAKRTPAPWVNVIANQNFGTVISESGQSYTWIENAHELRLTPWNNDPVTDASGEAFYLRDEESARYWSPAPLPSRGKSAYITRHGFGYSLFEHIEDGIHSEMCVYVDLKDAVKFTVIKTRNLSGRPRRLSLTGYVEWVLGDMRPKTNMFIITELDLTSGAIFARNSYNTEFGNRVAFFDTNETVKTITTDRTEFIGRNGKLKNPDAMNRARLSGKTGAALDACAAIQVSFDLANDEQRESVFLLGTGHNTNAASNLVRQFRGRVAAREALDRVKKYWAKALTTIQVETPDAALNYLTNG
ncbi:MAG: glucoamylase family protein, partial [Chitinophagales bacterium]